MVKKLLLTSGDDDFVWYVERTKSGNRYYMKEIRKREYLPVSKKEMLAIIKDEVEEYGYFQLYSPSNTDEAEKNMLRVRKLAPELLPKLVALTYGEKDQLDEDVCPPGYEFIPAKTLIRIDRKIVRGYCKLRIGRSMR